MLHKVGSLNVWYCKQPVLQESPNHTATELEYTFLILFGAVIFVTPLTKMKPKRSIITRIEETSQTSNNNRKAKKITSIFSVPFSCRPVNQQSNFILLYCGRIYLFISQLDTVECYFMYCVSSDPKVYVENLVNQSKMIWQPYSVQMLQTLYLLFYHLKPNKLCFKCVFVVSYFSK